MPPAQSIARGAFRRRVKPIDWRAATLALLLLAGPIRAQQFPKADAWNRALAPLNAMPVQDAGYVRSAYAFGDNHLLAIGERRSWNGLDALPAALWLMTHPDQARAEPLLKVAHPRIGEVFGAKRISLDQWREPVSAERLQALYQRDPESLQKPLNELEGRAQHLEELERDFAIVPRPGEWLSPSSAAGDARDQAIVQQWNALTNALRAGDPAQAEAPAAALAAAVTRAAQVQGIKLPPLGADVFYHAHQPFKTAAFFYLLAALGFGAALLLGWPVGAKIGYGLLALGLAEQLVGIVLRWVLAGRAPLSNLYESFTFAVGGMVLGALIFEWLWKTRLAGLGGAVLGFIFMVLAHKAPIFDSTIRPVMPALQSSWLTYHVVTIMLSYSAFALSFFVSICYLAKDALGGDRAGGLPARLPSLKALDMFNYRIVAVGFPLLTLGIVTGAVWADTAWGRPWGFDPKETWSAITWLIYAIYLHARFLAGWRGRWAAILALIGFAAVLFTYLGVNFLLPGLHSYA